MSTTSPIRLDISAEPDEALIQVTSHLGNALIAFRAPADGLVLAAVSAEDVDIAVLANPKVFVLHPDSNYNDMSILTPTEAVSGLLDALRDLVEAQSDGYAPPDNDPRMKAARAVLAKVEAANPERAIRPKAERDARQDSWRRDGATNSTVRSAGNGDAN
jgi:hypothetical protein